MFGRMVAGLLLAVLLLTPAGAQQTTKMAKIGWLGTRPASGPTSGPAVIQQELNELGYIEGKNITFERRYTEGKLDRLPALCNDLVRLKVDIILTGSTPSARAAQECYRGGLMSYGADRTEVYKRVASMVVRILKGTKPAEIPVEQPRNFELVINLKAAKQIGLTIPPNVLATADRVIR